MARADDDSWDFASSVGATATMVAAARTVATRRPDPLINDPFAESLVKAAGSFGRCYSRHAARTLVVKP